MPLQVPAIELIALLAEHGCWSQDRADAMIDCYRQYRHLSHQRALDEGDLLFDESVATQCRQQIRTIWQEVLDEEL